MKRIVFAIVFLVAVSSVLLFTSRKEQTEQREKVALKSMPVPVTKGLESGSQEPKSAQKNTPLIATVSARSIWQEYASITSVSQFNAKFRNAPVNSSERFLADYAVLSCGSVTTVGAERFAEFATRRRKTLPADMSEDTAQNLMIQRYITSCRDYLSTLTADKVSSGMSELRSRDHVESRALAILGRIHLPNTAAKNLKDAEQVLESTNPFAVQAMSQVWAQAAREHLEAIETSIFAGMSPDAVQAAWTLAACELGMDCGAKHELLFLECVTQRRCLAESVFDYYERYVLSRNELAQANVVSAEILKLLKNRNYEKLGIK